MSHADSNDGTIRRLGDDLRRLLADDPRYDDVDVIETGAGADDGAAEVELWVTDARGGKARVRID